MKKAITNELIAEDQTAFCQKLAECGCSGFRISFVLPSVGSYHLKGIELNRI